MADEAVIEEPFAPICPCGGRGPHIPDPPHPLIRVHFDHAPPEHERQAWCEWFKRHGIDPGDVAIPGWVQRDDNCFRITYESYERDDDGNILVVRENGLRVGYVISRRVQLEGPPLRFPRFPAAAMLGHAWTETSHDR